jgi:hypothetical protein
MACEAAPSLRIQDKKPELPPIANVVFFDTEKKTALVQTCTASTKVARVDVREVKNGGPAACDRLCVVLKKVPCPHVHVVAAKAGVDLLSINCSGLKTVY